MTFRHSGDFGDLIYGMAVLFAIGGKHSLFGVDRPGITAKFTNRLPLLKPLLEKQHYIESVECSEEPPDIDFVLFRRNHGACVTLIRAQCMEYASQKMENVACDGSTPWLMCEPDERFKGRVVVARSPRYNNQYFPWFDIVQHYGKRVVFVGLEEEHANFSLSYGDVEHVRTKNFLDLARIIAGADLFIGNQSSPMAVAMGLGVNAIQEVCLAQPDCIYRRKNVQYIPDGSVVLPDISGSGELKIIRPIEVPDSHNRSSVPPGNWQYPELPSCPHFQVQKELVKKLEKCDDSEADRKLFRFNARRIPEFFRGTTNDETANFKIAYQNAFHEQPVIPQ